MPTPDKHSPVHETQKRLLDATEALVAIHGIAATSLREVTDKAGVNLALVKYHFGSKNGLVEAMLKRRLGPMNERRIALLAEAKKRHGEFPVPLEEVLDALIRPAVEMGLSSSKEGALFLRVFGRLFAEPSSSMRFVFKEMAKMIKLFDAAFETALPETRGADMAWRKIATLGVVQHSLLMLSMLEELPVGLRVPLKFIKSVPSPDQVVAQLVAFSAAGMRVTLPKP